MKSTRTTIIVTTALVVVGGMIVAWAMYQKQDVVEPISRVRSFNDKNFEKEVVQASMERPVLVDFYAEWCFPCKVLDPVIKELAQDLRDEAVIGKLDTDKNLIARRFGINKIPAIFIIKDGEIKNAFFGVVSKEVLANALKEFGS